MSRRKLDRWRETRILKVTWQQNKNWRLPRKRENTMLRMERRLKLRSRKQPSWQNQVQTVKKSLEEKQHKTDDVWNGVTQKQQKGQQTVTDRGRSQVDCREGFRRTKKHEMEVEIEKVAKAQKEAQCAAEIADREEQIAHNKESRTTSSRRRTRRNTSRKWKLNSRRCVVTSSPSWPRTSSHRPGGLQEPKAIRKERSRDHPEWASRSYEQVAEKRQTCDVGKNDTNLANQSDMSKNTQQNVKQLEGQQKPVKKPLEDQAEEALTEIQVEEKQVAEIKKQGSDGEEFTWSDEQQHRADTELKPNIRGGMWAEMNDVSIATEVTSIKTAPTQRRRSRVNWNEHRDWCTIRHWPERTRRRAKHRDENETNKAKVETEEDSVKQCFTVRNIVTKEKLKDKSPRGQDYVEAHHEEVQGHESRGQGGLGGTQVSSRECESSAQLHFDLCQKIFTRKMVILWTWVRTEVVFYSWMSTKRRMGQNCRADDVNIRRKETPSLQIYKSIVSRSAQNQRWWEIINTLLRWWRNDWNCFFAHLFLLVSSVFTEQSQICVTNANLAMLEQGDLPVLVRQSGPLIVCAHKCDENTYSFNWWSCARRSIAKSTKNEWTKLVTTKSCA